MASIIVSTALNRRNKGVMDTNDPQFGERFSHLSNALQHALLVAGKHATELRAESGEADQVYRAISEAVEAAQQLRTNGGEQS